MLCLTVPQTLRLSGPQIDRCQLLGRLTAAGRQDLLRAIREGCSILDEDYGDAGVRLHVKAPRPMHDLIANWIF